MIKIEPLCHNAKALLPPAKAGGSHQTRDSLSVLTQTLKPRLLPKHGGDRDESTLID